MWLLNELRQRPQEDGAERNGSRWRQAIIHRECLFEALPSTWWWNTVPGLHPHPERPSSFGLASSNPCTSSPDLLGPVVARAKPSRQQPLQLFAWRLWQDGTGRRWARKPITFLGPVSCKGRPLLRNGPGLSWLHCSLPQPLRG